MRADHGAHSEWFDVMQVASAGLRANAVAVEYQPCSSPLCYTLPPFVSAMAHSSCRTLSTLMTMGLADLWKG